jgi:hypothetical protein
MHSPGNLMRMLSQLRYVVRSSILALLLFSPLPAFLSFKACVFFATANPITGHLPTEALRHNTEQMAKTFDCILVNLAHLALNLYPCYLARATTC